MADYISANDAAVILESAFAPYRCVAGRRDHGSKVSFCIFDHNDNSLHTELLASGHFNEKSRLHSSITEVRRSLTERGYQLNDWTL
ncbi:hypothetical protein [Pseudomonas putida]